MFYKKGSSCNIFSAFYKNPKRNGELLKGNNDFHSYYKILLLKSNTSAHKLDNLQYIEIISIARFNKK